MPCGSRSGWPPSRVTLSGEGMERLAAVDARLGAGMRERLEEIGRR